MYLYHNTENDLVINVEQIHFRQQIIQTFKHRFSTYGYHEIYTPTFEAYDLYAHMNGTVNQHEMIKTIDNTGKVLVLRPDITIPITKLIANSNQQLHEDLRYFYIQNVFRQTSEHKEYREKTQAGVEYFGNSTPEADAEIIALAIHLMKDLQIGTFKIELGHAAFFEQTILHMQLNKDDLQSLQQAIQAKNITELEDILSRLDISTDIKEVVTSLPFLYGDPEHVIERAKRLRLNQPQRETLDNIRQIYDILKAYGVAQHIVVDLSLINHMDYYSDMIFQGFIDKVGKPILMGGRYNTLAKQFKADIPAIGFAFDLDLLLDGVNETIAAKSETLDAIILFDKKQEMKALTLANELRLHDFRLVTYELGTAEKQIPNAMFNIQLTEEKIIMKQGTESIIYENINDILPALNERR